MGEGVGVTHQNPPKSLQWQLLPRQGGLREDCVASYGVIYGVIYGVGGCLWGTGICGAGGGVTPSKPSPTLSKFSWW